MKTLYSNVRLVFSGDTVCLIFGVAAFLASLANATQWPALRPFRFCGICTTLFSLTFGILTSVEIFKYQRGKRTIAAAVLFLAAAALCLGQTRITFGPAD
jgi:uncharacterized membrane protein